jgi:hypothetical protein
MRDLVIRFDQRCRGCHAAQAGTTTVEYGILIAVLGVVFLVAGQALFGGFGSFRDLLLGGFSS